MAKNNHPITIDWYERSYMWDRMDADFSRVSMKEALAFLQKQNEPVLFMSEKGEDTYYQGQELVNFVAEANAHTLAAKIEQEWYDSYRLAEQNRYDAEAFLPEDLYVFDHAMKWCVVFTHENDYWECELEEPMKAAESRWCMICDSLFPLELDGAKVLLYTPQGDYGTIKYPNGEVADHYHYLAICKYPKDDNYYLFCCNENYEVVNDWPDNSVEDCMKIATSSYKENITWNKAHN